MKYFTWSIEQRNALQIWRSTSKIDAGLFTIASRSQTISDMYEKCDPIPKVRIMQVFLVILLDVSKYLYLRFFYRSMACINFLVNRNTETMINIVKSCTQIQTCFSKYGKQTLWRRWTTIWWKGLKDENPKNDKPEGSFLMLQKSWLGW